MTDYSAHYSTSATLLILFIVSVSFVTGYVARRQEGRPGFYWMGPITYVVLMTMCFIGLLLPLRSSAWWHAVDCAWIEVCEPPHAD